MIDWVAMRALCACLLVGVTACGAREASPEAQAQAWSAWRDQMNALWCDAAARCCGTDATTCRASRTPRRKEARVAALRGGELRFDAAKAAACLAQLQPVAGDCGNATDVDSLVAW